MILVSNPGSTSRKYSLYSSKGSLLVSLLYEIKHKKFLVHTINKTQTTEVISSVIFTHSAKHLLGSLKEMGFIKTAQDISGIGVRVVHGGPNITSSQRITSKILAQIKKAIPMASIHNEIAYSHIQELKKLFPKTPQVAVFDTAFHHSIPDHISTFAIPSALRKKHSLKKYGFHGTSCRSIVDTLKKEKALPKKLVVCHLGGGCSMTAIKNGKSIDTTMSFTPLSGLIMSTRSGDIPPGALFHILRNSKKSPASLQNMFNHQGGLLALSEKSGDMRDLLPLRAQGNKKASLAIDAFTQRVAETVGKFYVTLGGLDCLVFTAGIGEGSDTLRKEICAKLIPLGITLDQRKNKAHASIISNTHSKVSVRVIPTNEMEMIFKDTVRLLS